MKFLEGLINFDKDNIAPRIMAKLKEQILNDESFDPDKVKTASSAAEGKVLSTYKNLIADCVLSF